MACNVRQTFVRVNLTKSLWKVLKTPKNPEKSINNLTKDGRNGITIFKGIFILKKACETCEETDRIY